VTPRYPSISKTYTRKEISTYREGDTSQIFGYLGYETPSNFNRRRGTAALCDRCFELIGEAGHSSLQPEPDHYDLNAGAST